MTLGETAGYNVIRPRCLEFESRGKVWRNFALTLLDTEVTESTAASAIGKRPQAVFGLRCTW